MEDPLGLHPMSSRRQGALFERNPVCALCYKICMDMCDEQGGINFKLIRCLEEADRLCKEIVLNPWELEGVEQYYHKMVQRLDSCQISLSCAFATVCVTLNCMTNLPKPIYQLAHDLRGLIVGEGNRLYCNLQQSAYREDIRMSGIMYGEIPPIPKELLELAELKNSNVQLTKEVNYYKRKVHTMEEEKKVTNIGYNVEQMTINMSGGTLVQHADLVQASGEVVVEKTAAISSPAEEHAVSSMIFTAKARQQQQSIVDALRQSYIGRRDKAQALVQELNRWASDGYIDSNYNARVMYDELSKIIPLPFGYDGFRKYYNQ